MPDPAPQRKRYDGALDVEAAIAALGERLPQALVPLAAIAYDYRWSWIAGGAALFRDIDPPVWKRSECNPLDAIEAASPRRLAELAADEAYTRRLDSLVRRLERDAAHPSPAVGAAISSQRPVAYVSSEFAVHCSLPFYGGGLGVLAGDFLKAAADRHIPVVGVGLVYRQGYMHQRLDTSGWQHEYWTNVPVERLPMVRVSGADGHPLTISVELRSRQVEVGVWRVNVGPVPLYLLDTDLEENHPIDRWITTRLYVGDRHVRLAQYAILGIGAMRALEAMGVHPSLVHLNEGHGAFANLERIRSLLSQGRTPEQAITAIRATTVFTTHTPVAAGNEEYERAEVEAVLGAYVDALAVAPAAFHELVAPQAGGDRVSLTALALRTSAAANGVSRRHGEVARAMWQGLWPKRSERGTSVDHVTNGVHTDTWMAPPMQALLDRHLGPDWREQPEDSERWERIDAIPDAELWEVRSSLRRELVAMVRERSVRDRLGRGEPPEYVEAAARSFDESCLTIGFARRMATYKRFYLLTRDAGRGLQLLERTETPMQLVVAGRAHPQDEEAKRALRDLFEIKRAPVVGRRVAFLEDYDMHLAPRIVAGVDLWLNLPRPPLEASGTSGMKVALNGALNLSVLDGWWIEGFDPAHGWGIESPQSDPQSQDAHDIDALYTLLEREVIPLFYARNAEGLPVAWLARVKLAMRTLIPRFSAYRMARDYVDHVYRPLTQSAAAARHDTA